MNLIPVSALPKIGWIGAEPLDPARFDPIGPVPLEIVADFTKPVGGLWTSPVIRGGRRGQIIGTCWTRRDNQSSWPFTLVKPYRGTRVVRLNSRRDLRAVIDHWPDTRPPAYEDPAPAGYHRDDLGRLRRGPRPLVRIDWPAMAAEVDAVYLTPAGCAELNLADEEPHLWAWDVPTVLFLNPTFSPGRIITPPDPATIAALEQDHFRRVLADAVRKKKMTAEQADKVATMLAQILAVEV